MLKKTLCEGAALASPRQTGEVELRSAQNDHREPLIDGKKERERERKVDVHGAVKYDVWQY